VGEKLIDGKRKKGEEEGIPLATSGEGCSSWRIAMNCFS
jgi:hypothetical protein